MRNFFFVALFLFATIFVVHSEESTPRGNEATDPKQTQSTDAQTSTTKKQESAAQPPIVINVLPPKKTEEETTDERHERKEKAELDRRLVDLTGDLAWFTAALFAATFGLLIATAALAYYAFRQSRDMKQSVEIAKQAAVAAHNQVELSREALISTDRAFVFCRNVESFWTADKATEAIISWTFFPVWKNSGRTPTRRARARVNHWVGIDIGPLPANFDFPDYSAASSIMIAPGAEMNGDPLIIPVERLQMIREGKGHAYIWGWFDYDDVFDGTGRHRSEFCIEIKVTGNPIYKEGGFAYALHGPLNGYDQDCYRQPSPPLTA
jgi:hypothetical protein